MVLSTHSILTYNLVLPWWYGNDSSGNIQHVQVLTAAKENRHPAKRQEACLVNTDQNTKASRCDALFIC